MGKFLSNERNPEATKKITNFFLSSKTKIIQLGIKHHKQSQGKQLYSRRKYVQNSRLTNSYIPIMQNASTD